MALDRAVDPEEGDTENVPAYYYLGQAIRAQVERQKPAQAAQALQMYQDGGAPLGHRAEVQAYLDRLREDSLVTRS